MNKVKYSILIPAYNASKYINETIDSILKQEIKDFEIIIINDGSTDNTESIVKAYQNSHIKLINQENAGPLVTRLRLIQEAKGDYTLFVDADDFVKDNWLTVINEQMTETQLLVFNYDNLFKDKLTTIYQSDENKKKTSKEILKRLAESHELNNVWSKCYHTSILKEAIKDFNFNKFNNSGFAEDLLINILYLNKIEKVKMIKDSLYTYRILQSSMSRNISVEKIYNVLKDSSIVYEYFSKIVNEELVHQILHQHFKIIFNYLNTIANANLSKEKKITYFNYVSEIDFNTLVLSRYEYLGLPKYRLRAAELYVEHKYDKLISYLLVFNKIKKVTKGLKWTIKRQF